MPKYVYPDDEENIYLLNVCVKVKSEEWNAGKLSEVKWCEVKCSEVKWSRVKWKEVKRSDKIG
jgi:hypothetical protein